MSNECLQLATVHQSENLGLKRRLEQFRKDNEEDVTVLNYFDELEVHPEHIGKKIGGLYNSLVQRYDTNVNIFIVCILDVEKDKSEGMSDTLEKIKKIIGEPRNYGVCVFV